MKKVNCGVVGVGYLGAHHARIYSEMNQVNLVGIYDLNPKRAQEVADLYHCPVFDSVEALAQQCDALSVVTPTTVHAATAIPLLQMGRHLLVEKLGGSLGGDKQQMYEVVDFTMRYLSKNRPTHLLGIGGLRDILEGVQSGVDTFDCVHPTRIARHGCALIAKPETDFAKEHINLKNGIYKEDLNPIDTECDCYTCRNFSRSYLHHLFKAKESTGGLLLTIHNARFMVRWMEKIRNAIQTGTWAEFYKAHCC